MTTAVNQTPLSRLCKDMYASFKAHYPTEGRRKLKLRVAEQFWKLGTETKPLLALAKIDEIVPVSWSNTDFVTDPDPWDEESRDAPEIGILVRTDYTNEDAWKVFYAKLQDAEKEFASAVSLEGEQTAEDEPSSSSEGQTSQPEQDEVMQGDEGEESSSDDGECAASIFRVINSASPQLTSISNLSALRLLNDVDIRVAPTPPEGTKRINPPNRLVDHDGWQEIYTGKTLWIYDAKSNDDQCVRLVNQQGDMYGTATGDSWRARVSHICELQVNLFSGAMKIDFGGLDRWDYSERQRNMQEANFQIS